MLAEGIASGYVLEKKSITFVFLCCHFTFVEFQFQCVQSSNNENPRLKVTSYFFFEKCRIFILYFILFCSLCVSAFVFEILHMMIAITLEPDLKKRASATINIHHSCGLGNNVVNYPDALSDATIQFIGIFPVPAVTRWHLCRAYSLFFFLLFFPLHIYMKLNET